MTQLSSADVYITLFPLLAGALILLLFLSCALIFLLLKKHREIKDAEKHTAERIEELAIQASLLRTMEEEASLASTAKTAFLANISHEIRTPMNSIIGFAELALDNETNAKARDYLQQVLENSMWLMHIVNDILDISKVESGKLRLSPVVYHTPSVINDVVTLNITNIGDKPLDFYLDITEELPSNLNGDSIRVKQILNNLLNNAIKYTQKGTVTLHIRCTRESLDSVWMEILVKDTGIGIREEDQKKIFANFDQIDTKANRQEEGTGLGLSITKSLVELMDGEISVESVHGVGSAFRARIRQGFVSDRQIGVELARTLKSRNYDANKLKNKAKLVRRNISYAAVLVVDDMQTNLDVAVGLMQKYKIRVDAVTSGQAAIDRVKLQEPFYDAIFMDHMMPGMDGIEAVRVIRKEIGSEYAENVPIIALTANAMAGNDQLFLENGFNAFLSKPIDIFRLDDVLNRWVRDKTKEKQPEAAQAREEAPKGGDRPVGDRPVGSRPVGNRPIDKLKIPGLDTAVGLSLLDDDEESYIAILISYATHCPGFIETIRTFGPDSLEEYRIAVHGIKGSSRCIGAQEAGNRAEELEKAAKRGELAFIEANNNLLIEGLEKIIAGIKNFLEEIDTES
jgi:signal transduction histidine kinase/FixJ family two-component response regulator/HPt (histidine-containing phosphotransfer) domain-containing protein